MSKADDYNEIGHTTLVQPDIFEATYEQVD